MRIIIDAMSGDNAPLEIVKGAVAASEEYDVDIVLSGIREVIEKTASELGVSLDKIEIIDAEDVITMNDDPNCVVRSKKDSSMSVGLRELKDNADAFISAGNTGALLVGASLIVRPIKGVRRPCIVTVLPFPSPILLADSGANINVLPEYLETWAFMSTVYAENVLGIEKARVGLLNNGAEEHKGTQMLVDTYQLMKNSSEINFVGNIEGRDVPFGMCDVLITDGFTGNVLLKYTEGFGKFFLKTLKGMYTKNLKSKISYTLIKEQVSELRSVFDAASFGGAPLLGLKKPVFKAHGSSDAIAIKNAVGKAVSYVENGVTDIIASGMANRNEKVKENTEMEKSDV